MYIAHRVYFFENLADTFIYSLDILIYNNFER